VHDEHGHITEYLGTSTDIEDQVRAREVLTRSREELEALVAERTSDLRQALDALHAEALERLQAEEALRQSQKMEAIGQLTGGIAHDFSNLLQSVSGSLEMARRRLEEGRIAGAVRFLDAASGATDRAAGLTQRLLAFARRQRLEPRPVDPGELVAGMADLIRRTMGAPVTVELRLGNDGAWVWCDPNALESALLNLCINARDAMPEGGRLTIATENVRVAAKEAAGQEGAAPGDYVAITASDTGEGMAPDVLERAFEPFFTTKPQGQGTGLGLSQVFGFARQSDGFVRLESAPGWGTKVQLCLPRHGEAAAVEEPVQALPSENAGAGRTVLLVDDEEAVREPVAQRLRDLGYNVLEAANGPDTLRLLDGEAHLDLLVTDVGLPAGMDGRQVAEVVRARRPGTPVLFVTGHTDTALPPEIQVIEKPFRLNALAQRIEMILREGARG
jgi:signal transduction histidine kinase